MTRVSGQARFVIHSQVKQEVRLIATKSPGQVELSAPGLLLWTALRTKPCRPQIRQK